MRIVLTVLLLLQPSLALAERRGDFVASILAAHNGARARHGAAPLGWSEPLAVNARAYANELARTNSFHHDTTPRRRKVEEENLWMGPRGVYGFEVMTAGFLAEEKWFRPGIYPAVSMTGKWSDVAHFSQMTWPTTTAVGCGIASNAWSDFMVCRYALPGNKDGHFVR